MISCDAFRARFHASTDDAALLDHIRTCDRCLDFAATVDPDVMFRALGGSEMIPPGGVDAFVADVMRQVHVREAETVLDTRPSMSWSRRLAIAATVAVTVTGATLVYRYENPYRNHGAAGSQPAVVADGGLRAHPSIPKTLTTKPVVETYDSVNATIVEMPSEKAGDDVKIVMIFDESLPADL